ncbi:WXG100 family type VII secretion target [Streptomyces meridianus]|uniref:WXG100 family type VII secretion target n=1 Tax=Streptomyces meridianus TaxID=2938945 RepID=A0ABT0XBI4_9ACTN|nr:WXG100 family type VII secretion target [Streptomyces meridianus]MCM2579861.1 WXG100 family type VII secretion target [Streptomyces meridianus]
MNAAEDRARALRETSAGWRDMGRRIEETVRSLDHEVGRTRAVHWQGPAAEAFTGDWNRLRKAVDEALPVFELAAADLDRAAEHVERSAAPGDDGASATAERLPASYNVAYAFTALSQIGSALAATFGRGRGAAGGARGRAGLARNVPQPTSENHRTADPFGPPDTGGAVKEKPTGGLGVAPGRRSPSRSANAGESSGTPAPDGSEPDGRRAEKHPSPGSAPEPAAAADTEQREAPHAQPSGERTARDITPAQPDPRRHGAFG